MHEPSVSYADQAMLNSLAIDGDVKRLSYDELGFRLILFLTNLADKHFIRHEVHQKLGYLTKSLANVFQEVNVLTH